VLLVLALVLDGTALLGVPLSDPRALAEAPPVWPPGWLLGPLSAWARHCDLLLLYAPPHYRALAGVGVLLGAPFYAAAAIGLWRGRPFIRLPALVYAGVILGTAPVLVASHLTEPYASPRPAAALAVQLPRWLLAAWLLWRMRVPAPFGASGSSGAS